jgi:hypothetical protein
MKYSARITIIVLFVLVAALTLTGDSRNVCYTNALTDRTNKDAAAQSAKDQGLTDAENKCTSCKANYPTQDPTYQACTVNIDQTCGNDAGCVSERVSTVPDRRREPLQRRKGHPSPVREGRI